jgi:hypothetical protein
VVSGVESAGVVAGAVAAGVGVTTGLGDATGALVPPPTLLPALTGVHAATAQSTIPALATPT